MWRERREGGLSHLFNAANWLEREVREGGGREGGGGGERGEGGRERGEGGREGRGGKGREEG